MAADKFVWRQLIFSLVLQVATACVYLYTDQIWFPALVLCVPFLLVLCMDARAAFLYARPYWISVCTWSLLMVLEYSCLWIGPPLVTKSDIFWSPLQFLCFVVIALMLSFLVLATIHLVETVVVAICNWWQQAARQPDEMLPFAQQSTTSTTPV